MRMRDAARATTDIEAFCLRGRVGLLVERPGPPRPQFFLADRAAQPVCGDSRPHASPTSPVSVARALISDRVYCMHVLTTTSQ